MRQDSEVNDRRREVNASGREAGLKELTGPESLMFVNGMLGFMCWGLFLLL